MGKLSTHVGMVLVVTSIACGERATDTELQVLTEFDTVVTQQSALLAGPSDVSLTDGGNLLITDVQANHVLVLEPDGEVVTTIGAPGAGPGEFRFPRSVMADGDTLRLVDVGNGRLQVFTLEGEAVTNAPVPSGAQGGSLVFLPGGGFVVSRNGRDSALAQRFSASGEAGARLGHPVAPAPAVWDFAAVKEQINGGTVPPHLRNTTLPVVNAEGSTWLILSAEGVVEKYLRGDSLAWSVSLTEPEFVAVKEEFFTRNRAESNPRMLHSLSYVRDAEAVGEELWLLLNTVTGGGTTIVVLSSSGSVQRRVRLPAIEGIRQFTVDEANGYLYVIVFDEAQVLRASLT